MTLTAHRTTDAAVLSGRRLTLLGGGSALALSGLLSPVAPYGSPLLGAVILLAVGGSVIPAVGLRPGSSVTGPRVLPRISLIIAGVVAVLLVPFFGYASVRAMRLVYMTGVLQPYPALMILWGLIGGIALIALVAAVIAGTAIGRSRIIPLPWAWLALPALIIGIVAAAMRACIVAASVMSWMPPEAGLYDLTAAVETWGAIGLGALMVIVALTAYRQPAVPVATGAAVR